MKKFLKTAILTVSVTSAGCASIVSDSIYPVTINSSPSEATFTITNTSTGRTISKGETPATLTLKSSDGYFDGATYNVQFEKPGYDAQMFTLDSSLDGWYIANLLFGGIIGMLIIDPATGAMWKLEESLLVSLSRSESKPSEQDVTFMMINELPQHFRKDLIRVN